MGEQPDSPRKCGRQPGNSIAKERLVPEQGNLQSRYTGLPLDHRLGGV